MTVAFYDTLQGSETRLSADKTNRTVTWDPQNDILLNNSSHRPVLCYRVTPSYSARLRLKVQIDGVDVNKDRSLQGIRGPTVQTFQEVIDGSLVHGTGTHNFTFDIEGFRDDEDIDGAIRVSDICIWYARTE